MPEITVPKVNLYNAQLGSATGRPLLGNSVDRLYAIFLARKR
jgi:hypothetical protein